MNTTDFALHVLKITRQNVLELVNQLTYEELCKIPEGFSNSILWNAVHNLVTQQILTYKLSDKEITEIPETWLENFRKGSSGKAVLEREEWEEFKTLYISSVASLKKRLEEGEFTSYKEYTTSYNITLNEIKEAISFNNTHEGLHLGVMMSIRKFL